MVLIFYHILNSSRVSFIAAELGAEFTRRNEKGERVDDLMDLVDEILAFDMQQNVEAEACDLLIEYAEIDSVSTGL